MNHGQPTNTASSRAANQISTPAMVALLIAVSAASPLAVNMYLPSMPGMARTLGVDYSVIQLTLSLYLATLAAGQLVAGSLSDRFGRRKVLLLGLGFFVIGSGVCLAADNITVLILGRILQAAGGCAGITMGRAIVRDVYERDRVTTMIAYVTMGMAVAPMIAPTIGGVLDSHYGWRGSFAFLTLLGAIVLFFVFRKLPETHNASTQPREPLSYLKDNLVLMRSRLFWGYTLTTSLTSAVFFAFVAGAPYVVIELMGRSATEYGLYFPLAAGGYIVGNFGTSLLAGHNSPNHVIWWGIGVTLAGVLAMAALVLGNVLHPLALFGPMFAVGLGNGLVLPGGIAGAVNIKPEVAGAAAGLTGSVQMAFGAIVSPLVGAALGLTVWPLIIIMGGCILLAGATFTLARASYQEKNTTATD